MVVLEEILEIPGVDMIQWGGSDYSMSIGKAGAKSDPEVIAAHDKVFSTSIKMGIPPRAEIKSVDEAKKYLDMGVKHFSIGTDISILHDYWKQNGDELRRIIS